MGMKVAGYRYQKNILRVYSRDITFVMDVLKSEKAGRQVLPVREGLNRTFLPGTIPAVDKLPVWIFASTFRRWEGQVQWSRYSGYVLLEVNGLSDMKEAEAIRREAAVLPQTLLAFIGLSGRSVKIIVPFTLPDGTLPQKEEKAKLFHAAAYQLAVRHYQPQLGSIIALKEPLLSRGCRLSYDPEAYYNPDAVAIRLEQPLQMPDGGDLRIVQNPPEDSLGSLVPGLDRNKQIATLYSIVLLNLFRSFSQKAEKDIQFLFIDLAQACCRIGIPEEEATGWTLRYDALKKYETDIRMTFRTAYGLKTMQDKGNLAQVIPPAMHLALQMDEFMERRYYFRQNEMSGDIEYLDRSLIQFTYQPYTQKVRNSICLEAQHEGLNVWDKDIDRYVHSNRIPLYHPILHFMKSLPVWDGKDYIRALAKRVPCSNPVWTDLFFRWFLSMVAHWMELDREHGNSTTPLLVGDQGCGKSTFCLNVLPPELRPYYTDSIDFSNRREAELALHRYALINIDEFDSVKKSHQSFLKHVLQKAVVNTRLPYQSASRNLRRYATFIATSNNFDLLTDPTGSRRFICVEVEGTIDYLQPVNYEQLYAQAKELLRRGERFWFTHEEEALIIQNNQPFQQVPAEEELFLRYFTIPEEPDTVKPLLASEILDKIAEKQPGFVVTKTMILNFGKLLKRNKVPNKRITRGTCYYVEELIG